MTMCSSTPMAMAPEPSLADRYRHADHFLLDRDEALALVVEDLMALPHHRRGIALDTETTGLSPWHGHRLCGVSIALEADPSRAYYIPVRHIPTELPLRSDAESAMRRMERPFAQASLSALRLLIHRLDGLVPRVVMHNAKFDLHMLAADGMYFEKAEIIDTLVLARLGDTTRSSLSLKALAVAERMARGAEREEAEAERDPERWIAAQLRKRGWRASGGDKLAPSRYDWFWPVELCCYAVQDVRLTVRLARVFSSEVIEGGQLLTWRREQRLLPVLMAMEQRGMMVDRSYCTDAIHAIERRLAAIEAEWQAVTDVPLRPFHHESIGLAFATHGITAVAYTERGQVSWDSATLERIMASGDDVPARLAACVLEARKLLKLKETYFAAYLALADRSGVIHPDYQQVEALTGRMSCRTPNLQNVTRDEADQTLGVSVRRAFVPRKNHVFVFCDWSQMELRILAHASGCVGMIEALKAGEDLHLRTARAIAQQRGIDLDALPAAERALWRARAKAITFGVLYGMGVRRLAESLQIDEQEAGAMWQAFWKTYPEVQSYSHKLRKSALQLGYVENLFGRRYHIPSSEDGRHETRLYAVMNWVIQGTGADMAKEAMIRLFDELDDTMHIVGMIHDEFIFECPADVDTVDTLVQKARAAMTEFPSLKPALRVPMVVDVSVGEKSWADKVPYDLWRATRLQP